MNLRSQRYYTVDIFQTNTKIAASTNKIILKEVFTDEICSPDFNLEQLQKIPEKNEGVTYSRC